jgi:hypothetical protein
MWAKDERVAFLRDLHALDIEAELFRQANGL